MAYTGTTAATSLQNPPLCLARGMGYTVNQAGAVLGSTALGQTGGNGLWYYASTDTSTLTQAAGYFTDGQSLGMRQGDILLSCYASSVASTTVLLQVGILMTTNSTQGWNTAIAGCISSS